MSLAHSPLIALSRIQCPFCTISTIKIAIMLPPEIVSHQNRKIKYARNYVG